MDSLWILYPEKYCSIRNESRHLVLYPKLRELITAFSPVSVLDYGCGDGSFATLLDPDLELGLFDVSTTALKIAQENLKGRQYRLYPKSTDIPNSYFDCVVLSLVLMTINSTDKVVDVLRDTSRVKKVDGKLIIAVTHPCFRQHRFSTFHTEFTEGSQFAYLSDGIAFKVHLQDYKTKDSIHFRDYHWSLSTMFNLIIESRLNIVQVLELPDIDSEEVRASRDIPPYIVIVCE